jgi:hypothetical protein
VSYYIDSVTYSYVQFLGGFTLSDKKTLKIKHTYVKGYKMECLPFLQVLTAWARKYGMSAMYQYILELILWKFQEY